MPDITVRGAGIMGLMVAWHFARRGASVQVIDPGGVGSGASGGIVGALAPHVPENWNDKKAMQFRALDGANSLWREIEQVGGVDPGYGRTGRLQPLVDEAAVALAQARSETAEQLWEGRYRWDVVEGASLGLSLPSLTGLVVHDTLTARLHPRRACAALAAALRAVGVEVVPSGAATGIEIWAAGAEDLQDISRSLGKTVGAPIKGQAALFECDLKAVPQVFADGLHIVPHADGTVAIGSTTEREFDDPTSTDHLLDPLIDAARLALPALANAQVIERWAGLRPRARSRAPMVGPHPTSPGAFIANGGFKIGLAMAPVVAQMLTDLILDDSDTIPDGFRPEASL